MIATTTNTAAIGPLDPVLLFPAAAVDQLEAMGALTGQEGFTRLAERWRSYDRASRRAALTVHKAAFVLSRYR